MANKKAIKDALDDMLKDVDAVVAQVAKEASYKAKTDFEEKAKSVVDEYYAQYNPIRYKREHNLYNTYHAYGRPNGTVINSGVWFQDDALFGVYSSNSRYHRSGNQWESIDWINGGPEKGKQYGVVDGNWVFDNFMKGIHPAWIGNKSKGYEDYSYHYADCSPTKLMDDFTDDYWDTILQPWVNDRFVELLIKR